MVFELCFFQYCPYHLILSVLILNNLKKNCIQFTFKNEWYNLNIIIY